MANQSYKKGKHKNNISLFAKFIKKAGRLPIEKRQKFIEKKFKTLNKKLGFPIVNKHDVMFVYKGDGNNVKLMGDMTLWQFFPISFNKLEGTDLFYLKTYYELDARLDYKFSVDDNKDFILDPLNTNIIHGGLGANSELTMPEYPNHPEANYFEDIPHGKIIEELIKCEAIKAGNKIIAERKVSIYLPQNYDDAKKYKVLYFKDGSDYIKFGKAPNILDYMINQGEIEPIIAVFVDAIDRDEDYVLINKDVYVNFFLNELMPIIEKNYPVRDDNNGRVLVGPSAAANVIAYIVYKHPEKFRYVLSQSGYFSCAYEGELGEAYGKEISDVPYPVRIFMVIGDYDLDLVSPNIWFYSDLKENPSIIAIDFKRYPQGHTWGLWRDTLREGLLWLFNENRS